MKEWKGFEFEASIETKSSETTTDKKLQLNDLEKQIFTGCKVQTIFNFQTGLIDGVIAYKDPLNFVHDVGFEMDLLAALT